MSNSFAYPRPEYPRPDRQRGSLEGVDWLNLNGPWQFRFDRYRRGREAGWFLPDEQEWREQIIVPFCWESLAAWGEGDAAGNENYYATRVFLNPLEVNRSNHRSAPRYEVGWYRRAIEIPDHAAWHGKRVILTVGASDFFTDCWCNGQHLGHHEGGYTPFEFDLTDALGEPGPDGRRRALVVFRVEDPVDNHEQPVGKQWRWYTTVSGIWQTVFVEPRSQAHLHCFRVYTDIDAATARFQIECAWADPDAAVTVEIIPPQGAPQIATFPVRNGLAEGAVKVDPLLLWNPNEPHLYQLVLRLRQKEQEVDTVRSYFGMRKIDFAPGDGPDSPVSLRWNGVPRYLRGALYQSYYPDGVYTAGDVQTLKNDIAYAKKVGFNFLRIHIKIDDPLLLYHADKMGMLLMADFPNFGEGGDTEVGRRRFEKTMREAIQRDFNHPSIFAWCTFNETWGFGGQVEFVDLIHPVTPQGRPRNKVSGAISAGGGNGNGNGDGGGVAVAEEAPSAPRIKLANLSSHAWVQSIWGLAKKLDPTRLIEDMSVVHWEHLDYYAHGDTDINSWHFYIDDYAKAKAHIAKIVKSTFTGSEFNYVPGYAHRGQPLINSEYGGVGALDGDRDISWSFKFLTNELRRHGQISAYIFTELHDVEWEHNGFLNYDRTPKEFGYDPAIINESDTLPLDAAPITRVLPGQTIRLEVASSHFSSRPGQGITLRWSLEGMDTRGRIHPDLVRGAVPIEFPHRRVVHAHTLELPMPAEPMLCTLNLCASNREGVVVARNFVQYQVADHYPPTRETAARALVLRGTPGDWSQSEWSGGTGDRERERAEDCCYGQGHGFFEWILPLDGAPLVEARRLRVLAEVSSHRIDTPQTDDDIFPTTLQMFMNGTQIYGALVRNHPHDARGSLSYLRGGLGAYGYLVHAFAEGDLLQHIVRNTMDGHLHLRLAVPSEALAQGGLTVYGAECGRYPVTPTVIIEW